jgi:hypothetical protein
VYGGIPGAPAARFWNLPQDWFVLGFLVAVVVSNAAWGWMSGAVEALLAIAPAIFCYFCFAARSRHRVNCAGSDTHCWRSRCFHAANGIVQFHTGIGLGGVVPIEAHSLETDDEADPDVRRIRGNRDFQRSKRFSRSRWS